MRRLAWVLVLGSAVSFGLVAWPAVRAEPPPRAASGAAALAVAIARKCVKDQGYRGAGGAVLVPGRATATPLRFGRFRVHVPAARGRAGLDLLIDVGLRTCRPAPRGWRRPA